MNLLDKALTQRTEVKLKKQRMGKTQLTKKEIELIIDALNFYDPNQHIDVERLSSKLNNQLKEMI